MYSLSLAKADLLTINKIYMKKTMIMLALLCIGGVSAFGQSKDTVMFDKSFEDAGQPAGAIEFHLKPKLYNAGETVTPQPIALSTAKKDAMELVRAKPTPLRRDCINLIYTVDPVYSEGTITGALKGTIVIKWDIARKLWVFSYLKYQLVNIDHKAFVFQLDAE